MDLEPGLRRDPLPDPEAVGEDEVLVERLRDEIRAHGPDHVRPVHGARAVRARPRLLPPARSRPRAPRRLPHRARGPPDLRGGASAGSWSRRGTRSGGPTRSSSRSPAPGPARSPRACSAGCGTSARRSSARSGTARSRWSRRGSTALRERLDALGLGDTLVVDAAAPGGETGAVVANEVLDALPVHRVVGRPDAAGGIAELLVAVDDAGAFVPREAPAVHAAARRAPRRRGRHARRRPGHRGLPRARRLARGRDAAPGDGRRRPRRLRGRARPRSTTRRAARRARSGRSPRTPSGRTRSATSAART